MKSPFLEEDVLSTEPRPAKVFWLDQFSAEVTDDVTSRLDQQITDKTQAWWQAVMDSKRGSAQKAYHAGVAKALSGAVEPLSDCISPALTSTATIPNNIVNRLANG